jgi:hypothetical protein
MRALPLFPGLYDSGAATNEGHNPGTFSPDGKFFAAFEQSQPNVLVHRAVVILSF